MHLVRVDHCSLFIIRDNTFFQIMIRARAAKILKNDGLITLNTLILKCILVSINIVFFMGVSLVRTPILG